MGKDGLPNSVGDVLTLGSYMPILPRGDPDMLLKVPFFYINNVFFILFKGVTRRPTINF
ncbi:hypothetical protein Hdeb2414_s0012g00398761 [Helianthus debilis subsp. tardiflorus]